LILIENGFFNLLEMNLSPKNCKLKFVTSIKLNFLNYLEQII
jgi:hypothetical protein